MSEATAFKDALRAAGQPWSRWGVRFAGAGIVALAALQIALMVEIGAPYALYLLIAVVGVIAVGWGMLIVAFVKRRRWARAHTIDDVPLSRGTP